MLLGILQIVRSPHALVVTCICSFSGTVEAYVNISLRPGHRHVTANKLHVGLLMTSYLLSILAGLASAPGLPLSLLGLLCISHCPGNTFAKAVSGSETRLYLLDSAN